MSREAFEKFLRKKPVIDTSMWEVWQAACDWQREEDAKICDKKAGYNYGGTTAKAAIEIRANKGEKSGPARESE